MYLRCIWGNRAIKFSFNADISGENVSDCLIAQTETLMFVSLIF